MRDHLVRNFDGAGLGVKQKGLSGLREMMFTGHFGGGGDRAGGQAELESTGRTTKWY